MVLTSRPGALGLSGMLKLMVSAPGVSLAARIASRNVQPAALQKPSPGSEVLVTVKVVEARAGLAAIERLALMSTASSAAKVSPIASVLLKLLVKVIISV